jgi:transcriptional regulator with XRE-family HTH domain
VNDDDERAFKIVLKQLGARIRAFREEQGFSKKELAELTGIPRQQIGHYEAGTEAPRLRNLLILTRFMNVSPADLIYGPDEAVPRIKNPELRDCVSRIESMGSEYCRGATDLLEMYIVSKMTKKKQGAGNE